MSREQERMFLVRTVVQQVRWIPVVVHPNESDAENKARETAKLNFEDADSIYPVEPDKWLVHECKPRENGT